MEVSRQSNSPAALTPGKRPGTLWIAGWVGPTKGMGIFWRKLSCTCQESTAGTSSGTFLGVKRPENWDNHSLSSNAETQEWVELHLCFPPYDLMACKQPASLFSLPRIVNSVKIKVDERGVVHQDVLGVCHVWQTTPLNWSRAKLHWCTRNNTGMVYCIV